MIRLNRLRTEEAIHENFRGAKRLANNRNLIAQELEIRKGDRKKHAWKSQIWGESKDQLLVESNNKCAYCESPLKVVAYGDVEHYRPKSLYWWLAYCYDNYLVSCTLCNQAFKKDKFPLISKKKKQTGPLVEPHFTDPDIEAMAPSINPDPLEDTEGMAFADFLDAHRNEETLLVNPYYEDPEEIFTYSVDDVLKEVIIEVKPGVKNGKKIQKAIVETYGLNRLELKQFRFEIYDMYATLKMALAANVLPDDVKSRIEDKVTEMQEAQSPYAGMIRFFERLS